MLQAFVTLLITCCVTHFIIQFIIEQGVQECDATMVNFYSLVWLKKIRHFHIYIFTFEYYYSVLKLFTGFAIAAFID